MNAVRGFLDHEAAHILFTDPIAAMKMRRSGKAPSTGLLERAGRRFYRTQNGDRYSTEPVNFAGHAEPGDRQTLQWAKSQRRFPICRWQSA
ncbi:hypothetical protein OFY05_23140 (plasmid) [Pseudocitrobacter faecalis]|nr:hypothetical protein OFY05_23140 [Pseudocitrobacter faecalis]